MFKTDVAYLLRPQFEPIDEENGDRIAERWIVTKLPIQKDHGPCGIHFKVREKVLKGYNPQWDIEELTSTFGGVIEREIHAESFYSWMLGGSDHAMLNGVAKGEITGEIAEMTVWETFKKLCLANLRDPDFYNTDMYQLFPDFVNRCLLLKGKITKAKEEGRATSVPGLI